MDYRGISQGDELGSCSESQTIMPLECPKKSLYLCRVCREGFFLALSNSQRCDVEIPSAEASWAWVNSLPSLSFLSVLCRLYGMTGSILQEMLNICLTFDIACQIGAIGVNAQFC